MTLITSTKDLVELCKNARCEAFITVDTEFMRTSTFWPELCLIQIGLSTEAFAVDPLACTSDGSPIDLSPFWELLKDSSVLKVFHAARQDMEIFLHLMGDLPAPVADTQIMATVLGFGESVSYGTLVARIAHAHLDKTARMTDWKQRPLSQRMIDYALADVIHLRHIYEDMSNQMVSRGRESWIDADMEILTNPETYITRPEDAWRRLKLRSLGHKALCVAKAVAYWREKEAQRKNLTRNRVLRDESLLDIAGSQPTSPHDLSKIRGIGQGFANSKAAQSLLKAVSSGLTTAQAESTTDTAHPQDKDFQKDSMKPLTSDQTGIYELAKLLLKVRSVELEVIPRIICNDCDLQSLARGNTNLKMFSGWRAEAFGNDANKLRTGESAIGLNTTRRLTLYDVVPA